jgi:hypothetical protein
MNLSKATSVPCSWDTECGHLIKFGLQSRIQALDSNCLAPRIPNEQLRGMYLSSKGDNKRLFKFNAGFIMVEVGLSDHGAAKFELK